MKRLSQGRLGINQACEVPPSVWEGRHRIRYSIGTVAELVQKIWQPTLLGGTLHLRCSTSFSRGEMGLGGGGGGEGEGGEKICHGTVGEIASLDLGYYGTMRLFYVGGWPQSQPECQRLMYWKKRQVDSGGIPYNKQIDHR